MRRNLGKPTLRLEGLPQISRWGVGTQWWCSPAKEAGRGGWPVQL